MNRILQLTRKPNELLGPAGLMLILLAGNVFGGAIMASAWFSGPWR